MANTKPYRIKTISQHHELVGLPKPAHPLISVVNIESIKQLPVDESISLIFDFYSISLKRVPNAKYKYGQQEYDFDEGVMFFLSPHQVFGIEIDKSSSHKASGWIVFVHPDFLWNTPLAKAIKKYDFFDYSVNEALYLSPKEEKQIVSIMKSIQQEYHANIDKFSQNIIISQLEVLLNYSERFYQRQFITRKISNHKILDRLESLLTAYFDSDALVDKGLPTVQYIAATLNISPNYLSGLLKVLTGQSTQQYIHEKLFDKAKEKIANTDLSISEIAYELGFKHPQSFSKLFKHKMNVTPSAYRQSFN